MTKISKTPWAEEGESIVETHKHLDLALKTQKLRCIMFYPLPGDMWAVRFKFDRTNIDVELPPHQTEWTVYEEHRPKDPKELTAMGRKIKKRTLALDFWLDEIKDTIKKYFYRMAVRK